MNIKSRMMKVMKKTLVFYLMVFLTIQMVPAQLLPGLMNITDSNVAVAAAQDKAMIKDSTPLQFLDFTTPVKGKIKSLIFKVDFQDVTFDKNALSDKQLKSAVFGPENINSNNYPLESVKAYYERASYGELEISGDVYSYRAKHKRSYYNNKEEYETLAMEVLSAFNLKIDYSQYDQDKDGYIDCISFNVPVNGTAADDFWYGCQTSWYVNPSYKVDGEKVKAFIINDEPPVADGIYQYNATLSHEIGHSMGLSDYYKLNSLDDQEGLKGVAGLERMDDSTGDFSAFSKIILGWIPKEKVQIADLTKKKSIYSLTPSNESQNCLLIPVGTLDKNFFSEYFLVEYLTPKE